MAEWELREAEDRFTALVDAALAEEPQRVTRHGLPVVVVLSVREYDRLQALDGAAAPTLSRLLLDIPQDDGEFERLPWQARPLDEA